MPLQNKLLSTREWLVSTTAVYFHKAQKGDADSLNDFLKRIQSRLLGLFRILTNDPIVAQDLAQDIYIKLVENIKGLDDPNRVVPWLYRIARNHFIDYTRRQKFRQPSGKQFDIPEDPRVEEFMDLARAMQQLDPEDRYLAGLVYAEGFTYDEAAEILATTEPAIRTRLFRIKERFRTDKKAAA